LSKKTYKKIFSNFFAPSLKGEVAENQYFRQLTDQGQNLIFSKPFVKYFLDSPAKRNLQFRFISSKFFYTSANQQQKRPKKQLILAGKSKPPLTNFLFIEYLSTS